LREATAARSVSSLDGPISDADGATRADLIGAEDPGLQRAENHVALQQALVNLGERDREVLKRYYVDGLAQTEIASEYGVSQMQVSRWITSSVKRLSSHLRV
jgi:RNA polymerase sigma-B factor